MITAIKIIFLLGFLILIHETGHFVVAKKLGIIVNEFAIGFGPKIFSKTKDGTNYEIRLIPLGGFVNLEGEEEHSEKEGSFNKAKTRDKFKVIIAGALVNILFGIVLIFLIVQVRYMMIINSNLLGALKYSINVTEGIIVEFIKSLFLLFTGNLDINNFTGPIGISQMVSKTSGFVEFAYLLSMVSISLGFTNLLPILPLDGGKALLIIIEAIRKKELSKKTEEIIATIGLLIVMTLTVICTVNDVIRIFNK